VIGLENKTFVLTTNLVVSSFMLIESAEHMTIAHFDQVERFQSDLSIKILAISKFFRV